MKMMHGAFLRAVWYRLFTRAAATPANISTNSEPTAERKVRPASPAMARARYVLPVPGGPWKMMPCRVGSWGAASGNQH
jgi:hypothetical protein